MAFYDTIYGSALRTRVVDAEVLWSSFFPILRILTSIIPMKVLTQLF